ncbi:multiheme c-type cytochrome [Botrimarina hoheduenensis]|uniref:Cytochrome c-552/4 domain-containing protein n=1 Tax=Botrimarina hoheduenensis TaxID=2528000 RepID=A0A5C5W0Y3_9BACT|nr:multiheme c-type cytochrome [Botrimarina hoheduenensis]TWT43432.1 hypothetical protein Pla111_23830 [Botrimarina hoheduenensis]
MRTPSEPLSTTPHRRSRAAAWGLTALAVLVLGRVGWLAVSSLTEEPYRSASSIANSSVFAPLTLAKPQPRVAAAEPAAAAQADVRLTYAEVAMLSAVCPTALEGLPAEVLPQDGVTLARSVEEVSDPPLAAPTGRLTGLRVEGVRVAALPGGTNRTDAPVMRLAQAPTAPPAGWLIAPERWFVPEDRTTNPPAALPSADLPSAEVLATEVQSAKVQSAEAPPAAQNKALSERLPAEPRPLLREGLPRESLPQEALPRPGIPPNKTVPQASTRPASPLPPTPLPASPLPPEQNGRRADPRRGESLTREPRAIEEPAAQGRRLPRSEGPLERRAAPPATKPLDAAPADQRQAEGSEEGSVEGLPGGTSEGQGEPLGPKEPTEPSQPSGPSLWPSTPLPPVVPAPSQAAESEPKAASPSAPSADRRALPRPPRQPLVRERQPQDTLPNQGAEELPAPPRAGVSSLGSTPPAALPRPNPSPPTPVPDSIRRGTSEATTPVPTVPPQPLFAAPAGPTPPAASPPASPHGGPSAAQDAAAARKAAEGKSADESHRELFARNCYPSARDCAECHERIYNEWSVSSHAYAFVSPMFHRFEEKLTQLSNGTVGHFCYRCHSPVAVAMGEARSTPVGLLAETAREGVTCIVCHRVNQRWGKSNGERHIVPGDRYAPIYGGLGGDGVAAAIAKKDEYKVKLSDAEKGPGVGIHSEGRFFDQLTQAEACTSCHQVAVHPGVKLEVVWEQYRASPACEKGVTCQECHMGRVPGMAGGYNYGPVAEINGKTVNNHRKQSSHIFYGPGYSIAHPGIFPQHKDAGKWTLDEWLLFDWRAGWGTEAFEERVEQAEDRGVNVASWFPPVWADADDRCDARDIVEDNLERLKTKRRYRELVMENGSKVEGPFFRDTPIVGRDLEFDYVVTNLNEGHNLPTASLGAQPQLWANVVLIGPDGRRLWETGYTDSLGDLCDIHSVDVRNRRIPFDKQLFNLQTMFLITGATGTDREFYLPVNLDIDQVAHLRPGAIPVTVTNHPPFIRMEMRSIAPLGKKRVKYTVPRELVQQPGRYRLSFRLRSRTEPMYFMRLCESTPEMLRSMIEGTLDIHPYSVEFDVY